MKTSESRVVQNRATLSRALNILGQYTSTKFGPLFDFGPILSDHDQTPNMTDAKPTKDRLLSVIDTAKSLGVARKTLDNWRSSGLNTIPHVKLGSRVMYRSADLVAFLNKNVRASTSDKGGSRHV